MQMSNFEVIAEGCAGVPYGHVPGHQYHDVEVAIGVRGRTFRAVALETWGSAQGHNQEHGRKKVVARNADAQEALREIKRLAKEAGLHEQYLPQAYSACLDALSDYKTELRLSDGAEVN
jgi:hypothetical protein